MSEEKKTSIRVHKEWTGSRLDRFVRAARPALSFPVVQTLVRKGKILLNGEKAPGKARLKEGDIVEISIREEERREEPVSGDVTAARFGEIGKDIPVLFEDGEILAIDKPSGIPVQPGNRGELGSILDLICRYLPAETRAEGGPPGFAASPVHRLDIETSGVLVIAKTRPAARELSRDLAEGRAVKTYLAVVEGMPGSCTGTIDTPLRIDKAETSRAIPDPGGRPATTHFSVLKELPAGRSLLEVRIETGRTHQIRAHMLSAGHPVTGDPVYGAGRGRMLLHAWKISLHHPSTGKILEIISPPPPEFGL